MPDRVVGLRRSRPDDDAAQIGWVSNAADVLRFAGRSLTFPVTTRQLQAHRDDPAIATFTAFVEPDEATPVGRVDVVHLSDGHGRLSRVIIDPALRGQGLAAPIISGALAYARSARLATLVLHVFTDNAAALRTYEHLGFVVTGPAPKDPDHQVTMLLRL
jgi:RimJ/RimL family protein N-acetyltransferase